jgi:hypothetical protein
LSSFSVICLAVSKILNSSSRKRSAQNVALPSVNACVSRFASMNESQR